MSSTTLSDQQLIERCEFLISDFCKNGFTSGEWSMRIPAEPNRDADLVFSELLERFKKVREEKKGCCELTKYLNERECWGYDRCLYCDDKLEE